MKLTFDKPLGVNLLQALRRAGYAPDRDSFVKPLNPAGKYPQFHVYADGYQPGQPFTLTIHLDQKAPTYGLGSVHGGEYEGSIVEQEAARVQQIIEQFTAAEAGERQYL